MKRKIIRIDEELCDGCGNCVTGCSEGALQIVDGKARLVKEDFCDGFGDCIGTCPRGALTIEEREAADFDIEGVRKHLRNARGGEAISKMEEAQKRHEKNNRNHNQNHTHNQPQHHSGGCPGMREIMRETSQTSKVSDTGFNESVSELTHWPVQIHLVRPDAPFFKDRELVVLSTCSPVAMADVHKKYIRGRSVVVGCPKLDNTGPYAEKLGAILSEETIPKVIVLRMEVPCCGGLTMIVKEAARLSGRKDLLVEEHVVGLDGTLERRVTRDE